MNPFNILLYLFTAMATIVICTNAFAKESPLQRGRRINIEWSTYCKGPENLIDITLCGKSPIKFCEKYKDLCK